ncbi:hypothetical protein FHT77_004126 [Rhizobium sp. BK181]|nr:hypothetical protein [Rhizobium sp. BK181]MCS3742124.1 hypothetical protein [Rhizobium sp. BK661]
MMRIGANVVCFLMILTGACYCFGLTHSLLATVLS